MYWEVDQVVDWLKALSLGQYEDSLRDGSVDGPFLFELTDEDLMNILGVEHKLHRKKILLAIDQLRSFVSPDNNNTTSSREKLLEATPVADTSSANIVQSGSTMVSTVVMSARQKDW
jgi:hypothetical protein